MPYGIVWNNIEILIPTDFICTMVNCVNNVSRCFLRIVGTPSIEYVDASDVILTVTIHSDDSLPKLV